MTVSFVSGQARQYRAASVGKIAFQVLSETQPAAILGTTSRGIFIQSSTRWVLFLSFERHRSPLTITLGEFPPALLQLKSGLPVEISASRMAIPAAGVAILAEPEAVWYNPPQSAIILPEPQRRANLSFFARQALSKKGDQGLAGLLPALLNFPDAALPAVEQLPLLEDARRLREAVKTGDTRAAVQRLSRFLGLGRGLTPSGDDLALGLTLALNRWQHWLPARLELQQFNRQIQELAYQKTTTLSANLIECAGDGSSDERIENTLDAILTGKPAPQEILPEWLQWGASSGVDALVGMSLALT